MTDYCSTSGIQFILPDRLVRMVQEIETKLPGWWWSISQYPKYITLSLGPGRNTPNIFDRLFSSTKEGGHGFVIDIDFVGDKPDWDLNESFHDILTKAIAHRTTSKFPDAAGLELDLSDSSYRSQSGVDLANLKSSYETFLNKLSSFEEKCRTINNFYIGSCDLSADCSIRGKRCDGTEFDVSIDLQGDATISDSINWSMIELCNDILTPTTRS